MALPTLLICSPSPEPQTLGTEHVKSFSFLHHACPHCPPPTPIPHLKLSDQGQMVKPELGRGEHPHTPLQGPDGQHSWPILGLRG